ncbi:MAG TPA: TasA family protein [Intrasporangium sp.]|uniref:TasA family protein n=1 Tax=Intrasporangium sp. TaxID=1925024 RepID=UPI002D78E3E2|nr:TasA family protein [Intrasporangium sp.]HET7399317.1 TasA family protein [Intrasporangium sp.]
MRTTNKNASGKLLASVALVAAAAGVAGLGTFGSFTSTTSASQAVGSGTVKVALGAAGAANRLNVAATGLVPGDTVQRAVVLSNTGNQDLATLSLTTTATTSSKLDTDATNGLQLSIDSCSTPWVEAGTSPAYTYTCTGTTKTVLASRPVVGSNVTLTNLGALGSGSSDNLRVRLTLPDTADNSFQGLDSVLGFDFTGTQRTATSR